MTIPKEQLLADAIRKRREWAMDTLAGWVRCPSTLGNEASAQQFIEKVYADLGLAVSRESVEPKSIESLPGYSPRLLDYDGRFNVIGAYVPKETQGRSLIVNGHVDVVSPEPVSLWTHDPFDPKVWTDDTGETWMGGRGAGDMKGGTVSALWAFAALSDLGQLPAAPLIFQSCIEEECTGNGTLSLLSNGARADACLIPEPFDQTLLVAQAGVLWFEIHILGKTTHVLGTRGGVNAIEKAWRIYRFLQDELEAPFNRPESVPSGYRAADHPVNLNLGVIQGGDWPSTVAGDCVMRLRMGMLPGTTSSEMKIRVADVVARACREDAWLSANPPRIVYRGFQAEPCEFDANSDFGRMLEAAHVQVCGAPPVRLHATCTTDVRFFNLYYGIPSTCYGPRALDIHGADERVSVDSMERVAHVMGRFVARWCGDGRGDDQS